MHGTQFRVGGTLKFNAPPIVSRYESQVVFYRVISKDEPIVYGVAFVTSDFDRGKFSKTRDALYDVRSGVGSTPSAIRHRVSNGRLAFHLRFRKNASLCNDTFCEKLFTFMSSWILSFLTALRGSSAELFPSIKNVTYRRKIARMHVNAVAEISILKLRYHESIKGRASVRQLKQ